MGVFKTLGENKKIIIFLVFLIFLRIIYNLYFTSSLVEAFQEGLDNPMETNPLLRIGQNSSIINTLRKSIEKINPDKIIGQLESMDDKIKKNANNIAEIKKAQKKISDSTK